MTLLPVSLEKKNSKGRKLKPESFHLFFIVCQEGIAFCKVKNKRKNVKHFMLHTCNKYTFQDVHSQLKFIFQKSYHPVILLKNCLQNWSMAVALDIFKD